MTKCHSSPPQVPLRLRDADPQRRDATRRDAQEFEVYYAKFATGNNTAIDHTAIRHAIGTQNRIRLGIDHLRSAESLAADVRAFRKAATRSSGFRPEPATMPHLHTDDPGIRTLP